MSNYVAHTVLRGLKRKLGAIWHSNTIKANQNTHILVILHLFYMESWPEICEYLKNLSPYKYDLIVTCMEGHYDETTLDRVRAFKNDARIIKSENIGWDVWPFITALHSVNLDDYDIVFKLQSKGIKRKQLYMYGQYFRKRDWFLNLFEGCVGPFTVHTAIRDLMDSKKGIGLVAAKNLIVEDPRHKRNMVYETLDELGLQHPSPYRFVAGTCFATRASLLNKIKDLDITKEQFNSKYFSFAHRMERVICFPAIWEGLKMTGPNVMRLKRSLWVFYPFAWQWRKYSGVRMIEDLSLNMDDMFAWIDIEPILVKTWKRDKIPVGQILREISRTSLIKLSDTLPYQYLVTRDSDVYEQYQKYNKEVWGNDLMSKDRFDSLIESFESNGDTHEKDIVVDDRNAIMDGQHRSCLLLYKYGPQYMVDVVRCVRYDDPRILKIAYSVKNWIRTKIQKAKN